ncbi:hypothetical protein MPTK1_1g18340 [Marchantia polymorpha subsp. ruderalis]|uniref:Uncharacterized protein n=2 Tax=Marchantia polymorpha TaxID=3197 RepID=A0AAF6ARI5_MARPO|nr:hypothetical protein MARPO_0001s0172 [Marchantia polymorpha]BBM99055.1 hypothetical protein Mp_1g18340 [Marchantia polymorpha subsp. ruderalis]|eukprot:PTQ50131.1 hypothetical protein MARPO_0001s0172 [Marchantia polymorpha]
MILDLADKIDVSFDSEDGEKNGLGVTLQLWKWTVGVDCQFTGHDKPHELICLFQVCSLLWSKTAAERDEMSKKPRGHKSASTLTCFSCKWAIAYDMEWSPFSLLSSMLGVDRSHFGSCLIH